MIRRVITLLTDFGLQDPYVAEMKAMIVGINPEALIIDISHTVRRHDIMEAAYLLLTSSKYFPKGTIHVVVVDPGVGTRRRSIVIATKRGYFIGPDNGVLYPASVSQGILEAREIKNPLLLRSTISHTFHGRDIFATTAAYLSLGVDLEFVGPRLSISSLVPLYLPKAKRINGGFKAKVIHVDNFGNVVTNITETQALEIFRRGSKVRIFIPSTNSEVEVPFVNTYGEVPRGSFLALINSQGFFELAVNMGSAANRLKLRQGDEVIAYR